MNLKIVLYSVFLGAILSAPSQAALLISEVVFNEVGSDTLGEWFEIFNTGPTTLDLTNYKIGDEEASGGTGTGEAMHRFPAGAMIAPGQVQIVAASANQFLSVYGFLPTYEASSTNALVPDMSTYGPTWDPDGGVFAMANGGDQGLILGPADEVLDAVSWGTATFAFDPPLGTAADGQSYERRNAYVDTNTAGDWQAGPNPAGSTAAQRSTPGTVPVPEPAAFSLLIGMVAVLVVRRGR